MLARLVHRSVPPLKSDSGVARVIKLRRLAEGHVQLPQAMVRYCIDRARLRAVRRRAGSRIAAWRDLAHSGDEPAHMADVLAARGHTDRPLRT